jgi:hypothetical protein
MKSNRSAEFLRNMTAEAEPEPTPAPAPASRAGLKHIGGYFALETVEKVALLRARFNLDNSELLKLAIDELYARHHAKRAFGDA